jgi:3',5'-cyclic AMP phosphodiesterase CpdA
LDSISGTVFTTGDNAYKSGTDSEFARCYAPGWGRHKARTRPAPGNHDHRTAEAGPYYAYFGAQAGDSGRGYYSYDLGAWHIVSLNSNIAMKAGSPQERWLRADLAATRARCVLAYWHHPRFSSGTEHGNSAKTAPLWQALYDHGADVVLAGHEHNYERFAPQTASGAADPERGIREFVVGTGGADHYPFGPPIANSEVRNGDTWGVLKLTLEPGAYRWQFVPVAGRTFADSGGESCR